MAIAGAGFEEWYRREHPRVLAALTVLSGDHDAARDATDEAFVRAFDRWEKVSEMAAAGGWTYKVALNLLRRRLRRAALERRVLRRDVRPTSEAAPAGELWLLVATLPFRQQQTLVLRYVAGLPEKEVATALGISRGTVAATLTAARKRLAELLADEDETLEDCRD